MRFSLESDQCIVCLVGDDIRRTPGVAARVFGAIRNVNVRMISQGASEINISFVVDEQDVPAVIDRLHAAFFADPDPAVFGEPLAQATKVSQA